ncbi:15773_t:CDS:2, partial [Funneliformis mosseae]
EMTSLEVTELQNCTIQILNKFSDFQRIKFEIQDNFIKKKISQISKQNEEFRNAIYKSVTHTCSIRFNTEDLIDLIECCEDDDIDNYDLLELLRSLLSGFRKDKENVLLLTKQLKKVKEDLTKINNEIFKYEAEKAKQIKDSATNLANGGLAVVRIGTLAVIAKIAAVPFTSGASLAVSAAAIEFDAVALDVGAMAYVGSSAVADALSITDTYLDYKLESVREVLSQVLRELQNGIENIILGNTSHFENGWEGQMIEIEYFINKLISQYGKERLTKPFVKRMAPKAEKTRKDLKKYIEVMQQTLRPNSRREIYSLS